MSNAAVATTAVPPSPHTPGRGQLSRLARQLGNRTEAKRPRWLAGVALPCSDRAGVQETGRSVLTYAGPSFHWRVNVFDRKDASCLPWASHRHVWISHLPGYMTLFWKKVLVPELTRLYDRIFILDNDVHLSPQLGFSTARIDRWFARTGASILTTSVIAHSSGADARGGTGLRQHHPFTASCAAHLIGSPERLHISLPAAYEVLWNILASVPDKRLDTDTGLMGLWTALTCEAFPRRPPCVLVNSIQVVHLNTKTISAAGLDPQYNHPKAKKNNVLFFFWEHPNYSRIANKSVDPYPANECGVLPASIEDFGFDWRGKIVAKRPGKGKGKAAGGPKVTCFPLLDESAGAGADGPRIDPTPTNPLGLQAFPPAPA